MPRPRIVVDTNVLVSAAIQPAGLPARIFFLLAFRAVTLYASDDIVAEYRAVLGRPKFAKLDVSRVARLLDLVASEAVLVRPIGRSISCPDEADNRFLECAEAAGAEYLITGNTRHVPKRYGATKVVTVREFLTVLRNASV